MAREEYYKLSCAFRNPGAGECAGLSLRKKRVWPSLPTLHIVRSMRELPGVSRRPGSKCFRRTSESQRSMRRAGELDRT